jgi:serine/threonine protein kinase
MCGDAWILSTYYRYFKRNMKVWLNEKPANLTQVALSTLMMQIVSGLYYLHNNDIIHGEISPIVIFKDDAEANLAF